MRPLLPKPSLRRKWSLSLTQSFDQLLLCGHTFRPIRTVHRSGQS